MSQFSLFTALEVRRTEFEAWALQDAYANGARVRLTLGLPGSGKSVLQNQIIAMEQKYGGFTFIFDIGNSCESVVELYGGKVDKVGAISQSGPARASSTRPTTPN